MTNFSTTYIAQSVSVLAVILPLFGLEISSEALTTTIQTILVFGSALYTLYERFKKGDVKWYGKKY